MKVFIIKRRKKPIQTILQRQIKGWHPRQQQCLCLERRGQELLRDEGEGTKAVRPVCWRMWTVCVCKYTVGVCVLFSHNSVNKAK